MPSRFFCPHCWNEMTAVERSCSACGYDLQDYAKLPYEDRLINALGHPVRENQMVAVQTLGNLKSVKALPAFENILAKEDDYYLIREIILALKKIGCDKCRQYIHKLKDHPSKMVRSLAQEEDN